MIDLDIASINKISVIGAGTMGAGIAQKYATCGFEVLVIDQNEESLSKARKNIYKTLEQGISRGIFTVEQAQQTIDGMVFSTKLDLIANSHLVIEAIFEDLEAKIKLLNEIEKIVEDDCLIASNTSSFSIDEMQQKMKQPERFLGLHYFFHPAKNRLVEVIAGAKTSQESLDRAVVLQEKINKIVVYSKDSPGFIVNRFFVPWLNESVRIFEEGHCNIATIENAAKQFFGVGMGPFELMNVTGVPITLHSCASLASKLGEFYQASPLIAQQVSEKTSWQLNVGDIDETKTDYVAHRLMAVVGNICWQLAFYENVGEISDIDLAARVGLLWPKGPFELMSASREEIKQALKDPSLWKNQLNISAGFEQELGKENFFLKPAVKVKIEDQVAIIKLNRPDTMNALNSSLKTELEAVFKAVENDDGVKGIVICGHKKAFMAGADLHFFNDNLACNNVDAILKFAKDGQELFLTIDRCKKPVIAAISGQALGGGLELALCCDKIVATLDSKLGFPETSIGIYPGLGGTQRTPARVGPELARFLVLTTTLLTGTEAKLIGLVDEICGCEDLIQVAKKMALESLEEVPKNPQKAQSFADLKDAFSGNYQTSSTKYYELSDRAKKALERVKTNAPLAIKAANELIEGAQNRPLEEGLQQELSGLREIFSTNDAKDGLKNALLRKKTQFQGQ